MSNSGLKMNHAFLVDGTGKWEENLLRFGDKPRTEYLKKLAEEKPHDAYGRAYQRHVRALRDPHTHLYTAEARNRVATGLGNPSPIEAGITTLAPYGVPMITGSSLKGAMLRVAINRFGLSGEAKRKTDDADASDIWSPEATLFELLRRFGWLIDSETAPRDLGLRAVAELEQHVKAECKEKARRLRFIQSLFGSVEGAGRFDVLHAWPVPEGKGFFMLDVVTCHHPDYYQGKAKLPSPMDQPVPVSFLSIRPKTKFLFGLRCETGLEETLKSILDEALRLGVGAKTLKGYGVFSPLSPLK